MEERNDADLVAAESRLLVRNKRITGNRDSSFSLRGLLNGHLMGPSGKDSSRSCSAYDTGTLGVRELYIRLGRPRR